MFNSKKIVYLGAFRFPNGDAAAARVLNNAKILRDQGHIVTFISWGGLPREVDRNQNGDYFYNGFYYKNSKDIDLEGSFFQRFVNHIFLGRNSLDFLEKSSDLPDFIIVYNPTPFFTWKIFNFCKRKRIKLISDLTEWPSSMEYPGGSLAPFAWMKELNMRFFQRLIRNKIVISSYFTKYYNSDQLLLLPPLIDLNEEKWRHNQALIDLSDFEGITLIYAGTPGKKDILSSLLQAIFTGLGEGLKLRFLIIGIDERQILKYCSIDQFLRYKKSILPIGRIAQNEVPKYYQIADFSVLLREDNKKSNAGFPTKIAESFAAGTPVITNCTSDICKYVQDGMNGFISQGCLKENITPILQKINILSSQQLGLMKGNSKRTGEIHFNYDNYSDQMASFLRNLH